MSDAASGLFFAAATLGVLAIVLAIAVSRVVRLSRRGAPGRAALRDGLDPIASSGAAQSASFGYTPAAPTPPIADVHRADADDDSR